MDLPFLTLLLLTLVPILLLGWWWLRRRAREATDDRPADGLDTLSAWSPEATRVLKAAERTAYVTLRRALPQHMILAQVPLARFIRVPTRHSYAEWLRRVGQLCADLVVCDRHSQVIAVVEVQTAPELTGHRTRRRQLRVARVLEAAKIPLHVWIDTALPSAEAARDAILPRLHSEHAGPAMPGLAAATQTGRAAPPAQRVQPEPSTTLDDPASAVWDADELIEMPEPPPSTWFDDLDASPAPPTPPKRTIKR